MLGFLGRDYSFFAHATDTRPTRDRHAIRVKGPQPCRGGVGRSRKLGLGGFGSEEPRRAGRGPGAGEDRGTRGRIEELSPPPEPGEVLGAATRAVSGQIDIVKS